MTDTMAATTSPASGSSMGMPSMAPPIPMSATTDESASDRWCHAFASSTGELIRLPIAAVARNRISLERIEALAAQTAMLRRGAMDGARREAYALHPKLKPAKSRSDAMSSEPIDSKRP